MSASLERPKFRHSERRYSFAVRVRGASSVIFEAQSICASMILKEMFQLGLSAASNLDL